MNEAVKPRFLLIPGSRYRLQIEGQEHEMVFDGRANLPGIGMLQWHDEDGKPFLHRVDDQAVTVIRAFT